MKLNGLSYLAAFSLLAFTACTDAPDSDKAAIGEAQEAAATTGETYKVDPAASKIEWIGTKVTGHHQGSVDLKSGELSVANGAVTGGNFVMDMTSIDVTDGDDTAANSKLRGHLLSADFFDSEKNPEAKFEITAVEPFAGTVVDSSTKAEQGISKYKVTNPTHSISGNLTIKGITKNIKFPAQVTVTDNSVDALAKFNIDRTEWNIVYPGQPNDLIRNEMHLGIALKATK